MQSKLDPQEFDAALCEWRRSALDAILVVASVMAAVATVSMFVLAPGHYSPTVLLIMLSSATTLVFLRVVPLVWPRVDYRPRAWASLGVVYVIALMGLVRLGLAGNGRLTLVVLPIVALILLGLRPCIVVGVLSFATMVACGILGEVGLLDGAIALRDNPWKTNVWLNDAVVMLTNVGTAVVLLIWFWGFLMKTLRAERAAHDALRREATARMRLEGEVLEVEERERRNTGADLHDGVCQVLTGTLLQCQSTEAALRSRDVPEAEHLAIMAEQIDLALEQAHEMARGLTPGELGPEDLPQALRDMLKRIERLNEVSCEFTADSDFQGLDGRAAMQIYRIAQEAVCNAARHARASTIRVHASATSEGLRVAIEDDGKGIRASAGSTSRLGLHVMAYRADAVGGSFCVLPRAGGGTTVELLVPSGNSPFVRSRHERP